MASEENDKQERLNTKLSLKEVSYVDLSVLLKK